MPSEGRGVDLVLWGPQLVPEQPIVASKMKFEVTNFKLGS